MSLQQMPAVIFSQYFFNFVLQNVSPASISIFPYEPYMQRRKLLLLEKLIKTPQAHSPEQLMMKISSALHVKYTACNANNNRSSGLWLFFPDYLLLLLLVALDHGCYSANSSVTRCTSHIHTS